MPSVDLARRVACLSRTAFRTSDFVCNFVLDGTDQWINLTAKAFVSLGVSRDDKPADQPRLTVLPLETKHHCNVRVRWNQVTSRKSG
jgi:hypothetical protein